MAHANAYFHIQSNLPETQLDDQNNEISWYIIIIENDQINPWLIFQIPVFGVLENQSLKIKNSSLSMETNFQREDILELKSCSNNYLCYTLHRFKDLKINLLLISFGLFFSLFPLIFFLSTKNNHSITLFMIIFFIPFFLIGALIFLLGISSLLRKSIFFIGDSDFKIESDYIIFKRTRAYKYNEIESIDVVKSGQAGYKLFYTLQITFKNRPHPQRLNLSLDKITAQTIKFQITKLL